MFFFKLVISVIGEHCDYRPHAPKKKQKQKQSYATENNVSKQSIQKSMHVFMGSFLIKSDFTWKVSTILTEIRYTNFHENPSSTSRKRCGRTNMTKRTVDF